MKKKILLTLMVITISIIAFGTISASAATSGRFTYNVYDGKATITDCVDGSSISIPDTLGGYPVVAIGDKAFYDCITLASVTIPNGVITIGDSAFYDCDELTSIRIPNSVTTIGKSAFSSCDSLATVIISDNLTTIGDMAFSGCISLTNVSIPDSVNTIGDMAFSGCDSLTSINVSDNNENYSSVDGNLYNKDKTIFVQYSIGKIDTHFEIPSKITIIGTQAFSGCENLKSITIPNSVITISERAFSGCTNFRDITIPNSVITIGGSAFYGCDSVTTITIPDSVTNIGASAFSDCEQLRSITIPNSVTSIGSYAFRRCKYLARVTIPDSVTNIGQGVFDSTQYYDTSSNWENNVLYIGNHLIKAKSTISGDYSIKEGTLTISKSAFEECQSLTNVTIPDSIITIGDSAFFGCISLASIDVSNNNKNYASVDGVLYNKDKTFLIQYLSSKTDATFSIPEGVTTIGQGSFLRCKKLTNVIIPDSVIIIGDSAFEECTKLTSITIGNGVTTIGDYAFKYCQSIESITIPNGVTTIGEGAFEYWFKLNTVYYNGDNDGWNKIIIGEYNEKLINATRKYFLYVTLCNKDETEISKKMQDFNTMVDTSAIVIPDGCEMVLYTDKEQTTVHDINAPINRNLTLYVDFIKPNAIEFDGTTTANIGEQGITQNVSFATDKEAKYFSCTLKIPNSLTVQEIKSDIFDIEQDWEIIGNDTHYYLFLIYNGDGNIPTYQTLNAFEIVFDVSENAVADEILKIEILDDAILADDNGNSYEFTSIGKVEIKINPILAEEITIVGADGIDKPTQYTVSVLPENTTNSNVEWSVSDETIATISEDGVLTPVKKGNVTVRVTAKDGSGVYDEKIVSVKVLGTVNSIVTNIGIWDKEYSPDTTNYTIYVPKSTTSIRLTAKHDGTFKTDKTTFVNNVTRPVTLSTTSDETVLDLSYSCDGYDDNKYTITIIKFEGTKTEVSEDKKSFTITPINIENGKTVILALYNGEQFVEMQSAVYSGEAVPFTTTKAYTKAKVMVWDDLTTLKPVCEVENIQ